MEEADKRTPIYLDIEDDITNIIGKVSKSEGKELALVIPKRLSVLASAVNMKLLKKSAHTANKKLVLVSEDPVISTIAGRLDMRVASSLRAEAKVPELESTKPKAMPSDVIEGDAVVGADSGDAKDKEAVPAAAAISSAETDTKPTPSEAKPKRRVPDFDRFRKRFGLAALGVISFAALIWVMFAILPKVKITIEAATEPFTASFDITADAAAQHTDYNNGVLAATSHDLSKTLTKTFPATGKKDAGTKASGTISAKSCYQNDVTVNAGDTFTSSNNLKFAATETVTIPAYNGNPFACPSNPSKADVPVEAAASGAKYNTAATTYKYDNDNSIQGDGTAMSGGSTKTVSVVSAADINNAKKELLAEERAGSKKALAGQFEDDDYLIDASFSEDIKQQASDPALGAEASTARLTLSVIYHQMAVKKTEITELFRRLGKEAADKQNKQAFGVVKEGLDSAQFKVKDPSTATAKRLAVKADMLLGPDIDFEDLKTKAAGKKFSEIVDIAKSYPGVSGADVKFSPFYIRKAPQNADKISVEIKLP